MGLFDGVYSKGLSLGLAGGFVGTAVMDVIMVLTFVIAGQPADVFFSAAGGKLGQGWVLGLVIHNMIGLAAGLTFAAFVLKIRPLRIDTMRKGLLMGVSYGAVTIPLGCIPLAIWLGEPIFEVVSFSFAPHLAYGTVLGAIVAYGLLRMARPAAVAIREP